MESAHRQIRLASPARGAPLLDELLSRDAAPPHECGGRGACGSCVVLVRSGHEHLCVPDDDEQDLLDKCDAVPPEARLACRAIVVGGALEIEIPAAATARAPAPPSWSGSPVALSARAAAYLRAQLDRRGADPAVRLAVRPAGCSGLRYEVDYAGDAGSLDAVFEARGIRIVVDPGSLPFVGGTMIDLVQEGLARRLRFDNPNARQTCGCGESFGT